MEYKQFLGLVVQAFDNKHTNQTVEIILPAPTLLGFIRPDGTFYALAADKFTTKAPSRDSCGRVHWAAHSIWGMFNGAEAQAIHSHLQRLQFDLQYVSWADPALHILRQIHKDAP